MTGVPTFDGKRVSRILEIPLKSRTEFENLELLELTYSINFFSRLRAKYSDVFHQKCSKYLTLEKFSKNQYIYQKGEPSLKYYILLQGEVSLLKTVENSLQLESSSSSSEELAEDYGLNNRKNRFRAFDINSEIVYELSKASQQEKYNDSDQPIISKAILEKESQELIEFIIKVQGIEENEKEIKSIKAGGDFGHDAFFPTRIRGLNAVARTQVEVASLHKIIFKKIVHEIANERGMQMIGYLQKTPVFDKWGKSDLAKILNFFKTRNFTKGQYLYKEGEFPSFVYFVIKGNFAIRKSCNKPLTQQSNFGSSNLRNFSSSNKQRLIKFDLVIKGEYEVLGADEICNKLTARSFSCICNSASSETFELRKDDFEKFVKPEYAENWFLTLKANTEWLKTRSEELEESHEMLKFFDTTRNLDLNKQKSIIRKSMELPIKSHDYQSVNTRRRFSLDQEHHERPTTKKTSITNRLRFHSFDLANIHIGTLKKNNPRLAPPNFLMKFRQRTSRKDFNFSQINPLIK